MNKMRLNIFIFALVLLSACVEDQETSTVYNQDRMMTISVGCGMGNPTRVGLALDESTRNMRTIFQSDDVFHLFFRQGNVIEEIKDVPIVNLSEDGKRGNLQFSVPKSIDKEKEFSLYGTCGLFSTIRQKNMDIIIDDMPITDGQLVIDDNATCLPISEFHAPVWFKATITNVPSRINCEYIGTYLVTHITNSSTSAANFQIWGLLTDELMDDIYWEETSGAFVEKNGITPVSSSISIPTLGESVFVYCAIPKGNTLDNISASLEVDGKQKTTSNTLAINKQLLQGHAYHLYLNWDGNELQFGTESSGSEPIPDSQPVNGDGNGGDGFIED